MLVDSNIAALASANFSEARDDRRNLEIKIVENGARSAAVSGDETSALCSAFRLKQTDVEVYFVKAKQVPARAYDHDLQMSRCFASGTLKWHGGLRGRWSIDMERRGLLVLANGRRLYFYCGVCTAPQFDAPYDPDKDG